MMPSGKRDWCRQIWSCILHDMWQLTIREITCASKKALVRDMANTALFEGQEAVLEMARGTGRRRRRSDVE